MGQQVIGICFEISYRTGTSNRVELQAAIATCGVNWAQLQQELGADPSYNSSLLQFRTGKPHLMAALWTKADNSTKTG